MKSLSTLQISLGISIAVHAALLTVRLVDPERFDRVFQDAPLDVILVNAKSRDKPENAKVIAQSSLAGGGDLEKGRSTSPLAPSAFAKAGDAEEEDPQKTIESMKAQQTQLLLQRDQALAAMPPTEQRMLSSTPAKIEHEERRRRLVTLLAEIERRVNENSEGPKKRYVGPATREEVYALYYDALRRKIESKGTMNFPQSAGKKLYGELTMTITVNFDGRVLETKVVQSSGNRALDRQAQAIVRGTGPFDGFSQPMRNNAEQIVVASSFNFAPDDSVQTKLTQQ